MVGVRVFIFILLLLTGCNFFSEKKEKMSSTSVHAQYSESHEQSVSDTESRREEQAARAGIDFAFLFHIFLQADEKDYLRHCSIITRPKLPVDFGISAARGGGVDPILAEYFRTQAFSSSPSPQGISHYARCMLTYAALAAQSHLNLLKELQEAQRNGGYDYDDLVVFAYFSYEKTKREGITDENLKAWLDMFKKGIDRCRYSGDVTTHLCGNLVLNLSEQTLSYGGSYIWSSSEVMGVAGKYTFSVSSAYAKQRATELSRSIDTSKVIDVRKIL